MAHIDALIDKIADQALQQALRTEVASLTQKRGFGLVFQEHKPESVELPNYRITRHSRVHVRADRDGRVWNVNSVGSGAVSIRSGEESRELQLRDVVAVREFGEAIYPGLKSLGKVERGGSKPFNVAINAENYHALETLLYAYEEQVDAIYIDPPYNSGAKDWKYNNDYVDDVDDYRHSKWLAFMQRRLRLAKRLLKPSGVLIVTIDEHEVHHLGTLLEQEFREFHQQMVTIVNNPKGVTQGYLSRVEEYALFCFGPDSKISAATDDLLTIRDVESEDGDGVLRPRWKGLLRSGDDAQRSDRYQMFYPVWIDPVKSVISSAGDWLPEDQEPDLNAQKNGLRAVWPVRKDGSLGRWGIGPATFNQLLQQGLVKLGKHDRKRNTWGLSYLSERLRADLDSGLLEIFSFDQAKKVADVVYTGSATRQVKTVWHRSSHDAGANGTDMLRNLLGNRRSFPFPKSLYAVEDCLRVAVGRNREALVVDFFAGSGTTAHALARLNAADGGERRAILVTNNEVSTSEAERLRDEGHLPGDPAWEDQGIFHYVTRPRLEAALTGATFGGESVPGKYLNGPAIAEGLNENLEFFELTYEDPDLVSMGRSFSAIAPLLWLKAGAIGPRIEAASEGWAMPENGRYAVLFDVELWRSFTTEVWSRPELTHVFIVTESSSVFQQVVSELPSGVEATHLYEDYLRTFEINTEVRA